MEPAIAEGSELSGFKIPNPEKLNWRSAKGREEQSSPSHEISEVRRESEEEDDN